jgi:hypothetical protein
MKNPAFFTLLLIVGCTMLSANAQSIAAANTVAPGIEQYSQSLPTDQFERLFCEVDDDYVSIRGNGNEIWVDVFDEDGVWISQVDVLDPDGIKTVKYHGAKVFQDNIYVFFSGRSETTAKGHYGLYAWKYSNEIGDFKEPKLLDEFPLTANINRFFVDVSPNGKYIGFVIEPKTFCKIYKHSAAVFTDNFEKVFSDNCKDQEFET